MNCKAKCLKGVYSDKNQRPTNVDLAQEEIVHEVRDGGGGKAALESAFAEEGDFECCRCLAPEAKDALGDLDRALVWQVVRAVHDLKVQVGDALRCVEDLFEREKEWLVCRNKKNRYAGRQAVEVLRDLHTGAVATDRQSLGNLVCTALDGTWSRKRLGQHACGESVADRWVPETHVLVGISLGSCFLPRVPVVLLEEGVASEGDSVNAFDLVESRKDALEQDDRVEKVREVIGSLLQSSAAK